jgi:hypothetical protein
MYLAQIFPDWRGPNVAETTELTELRPKIPSARWNFLMHALHERPLLLIVYKFAGPLKKSFDWFYITTALVNLVDDSSYHRFRQNRLLITCDKWKNFFSV